MQTSYNYLIEKTGITLPLIGFYDTPDISGFEPSIKASTCVFAYFTQWGRGKSVVLTQKQYGCPGAGSWLCDVKTRSRADYVSFLADEEGLKVNHELMDKWLDFVQPYKQEHKNLVIGPLRSDQYKFLKTVTFFVNPDQLSMLMIGAQVFASPTDPEPVLAPFGSGCMQLVSLFSDLSVPQSIIGATDMAMRKYLPPDILAFTVTKRMFEQLCSLDEKSYLEKRFIRSLKNARGIGV